jgi:hypothetical protein
MRIGADGEEGRGTTAGEGGSPSPAGAPPGIHFK